MLTSTRTVFVACATKNNFIYVVYTRNANTTMNDVLDQCGDGTDSTVWIRTSNTIIQVPVPVSDDDEC